jgi:uncharacterized protein YpuA (DUF1002 family)
MRPAQLSPRRQGRRAALLFFVTLLLATAASQVGMAAKSGKVITLGESLSDAQRKEMLQYFSAKSDDKVYTITEKDTNEAMKGILDNVGQGVTGAYSSTALTCRDLGEGLDVATRNISLVTPSMYAMALVTAGIGDATLIVSGPFDSAALGLSAMTGVFKTWDIAPCTSGNTSKERQRLALEQLALVADIGQAISAPGLTDGVQPAADVILETQKTIVTNKLTKSADIDAALLAQEQAKGIVIPADLRPKVVDLFVRLAKTNIDWSTFSAGWTIEYKANTQITMKGDGIAIRHARQTATAEAAAAMTATAQAAAEMTATAEADAAVQATQDAIAALTATAAAQPTATAVPSPTATPAPFGVSGKVTALRGDQLSVRAMGQSDPTQYTVDGDATISRDGKSAKLTAVKTGDSVSLTIDGNTNHVRVVNATAAPVGFASRIVGFWWLIPLAGAVGGFVLVRGRVGVEPFVVKRVVPA